MKSLVSKRAAAAAAALVILHLIATGYVQATDMPYDQGDMVGLLWWLVELRVLLAIALIVVIVSLTKHLLKRNNGGQ